jgi:hypothetical protein
MDVWHARLTSALMAGSLLGLQTLTSSWAAPLILEESVRIAPSEANFPLNGPVAVHGNYMLASSRTVGPGLEIHHFAAYLYERTAASAPWSLASKLMELTIEWDIPPPFSVALQGTLAVVATFDGAYVFERTAAGWTQTALIQQPRRIFSDAAISAGRILLGTNDGRQTGYLYQKNAAGQWAFVQQISAGFPESEDSAYGPDLDIFGDKIVIGNPDIDELEDGGVTWLYRQQGAGWSLIDRLASNPQADSDARLTAIFNDAAHTSNDGGVSVFQQTAPDHWTQLNRLVPVDELMNGYFIRSLDLGPGPNQDMLAFGETTDEDRTHAQPPGGPAGAVTLAARRLDGNREYVPVAKLLPSDSVSNLHLGGHISLFRNTLAASSARDLYVFQLPNDFSQPDLRQDDFEDGNSAGWTVRSSVWSVVSSLGSRVFRQTRNTGDALAILDGVDWSNQSIQADVRPLSFNGADRSFTVLARYVDENNYYYAQALSSQRIVLGKRVNGSNTTFGAVGLAVTANRDYRVRLEVIGSLLRLYVDGNLLLEARDKELTHGTVGLRTFWAQADFDNVVVTPSPALTLWTDNFENKDQLRWSTQPEGNWTNAISGSGRVIRQSVAAGDARALTGVPSEFTGLTQIDQIVEARARALSFISGQDPWFGLIARYRDDRNYTYITVNRNGYISLRKLVNGAIQVFDTTSMKVTAGTWYRLRLEAIGDRLRVYANGRLVLEGVDVSVDTALPGGHYGLMTSRASAEFDDVKVIQP